MLAVRCWPCAFAVVVFFVVACFCIMYGVYCSLLVACCLVCCLLFVFWLFVVCRLLYQLLSFVVCGSSRVAFSFLIVVRRVLFVCRLFFDVAVVR